MRLLVTGASGFVGRNLVPALAQEHEVVVAVRRAGSSVGADFEVTVPDVGPGTDWSAALEAVDVVVHLAARVHVMKEREADPLEAFRRVNVRGTEALARQAANAGVRRFVYLSSIKVNGERTYGVPFSDTDHPAPIDPYGRSKLEAEQVLKRICAAGDMMPVILRSPLIYGPGVGGNVLRLARLVRRGVPLPFASVHNKRSMLSTENLVEWVRHAIVDSVSGEGAVLVSDPVPLSTPDLVRELAAGMGRPSRLVPFPVLALCLAGRALGHRAEVERLVTDLEVTPSIRAFSTAVRLETPDHALRACGEAAGGS